VKGDDTLLSIVRSKEMCALLLVAGCDPNMTDDGTQRNRVKIVCLFVCLLTYLLLIFFRPIETDAGRRLQQGATSFHGQQGDWRGAVSPWRQTRRIG
jgi:hypothetical protein